MFKNLTGFLFLLAAIVVWGLGTASAFCNAGGSECDNWTSNDAAIVLFWVLIAILSIAGLTYIIKDLVLSKDVSKIRKIALIVSALSLLAVPYSIIITPVLFMLTFKYVK